MNQFDLHVKCSELCGQAYLPVKDISFDKFGLKLVKYLESKKTDTQGFVAVDDINMVLFVVFRGTRGKDDIVIDLKFSQISFTMKNGKSYAHMGFVEAYQSIDKQIRDIDLSKYSNYDIVVTGHSLGGALATLAASTAHFPTQTRVVTFGSPKVGDKKFVKNFATAVPNCSRVVFEADVVPFLPTLPQYEHVHGELRIDSDGKTLKSYGLFVRIINFVKCFISRQRNNPSNEVASIHDHKFDGYIRAMKNRAKRNL
jgi:hypothetical protein